MQNAMSESQIKSLYLHVVVEKLTPTLFDGSISLIDNNGDLYYYRRGWTIYDHY